MGRLRHVSPLQVFVAIAMAAVVFVIIWLYTVNRNATQQNRRLIREHQIVSQRSLNTLRYVCSTLQKTDVFVVQVMAERLRLEKTLHGQALQNSRDTLQTLNVLHIYLNDRRACDEVTG